MVGKGGQNAHTKNNIIYLWKCSIKISNFCTATLNSYHTLTIALSFNSTFFYLSTKCKKCIMSVMGDLPHHRGKMPMAGWYSFWYLDMPRFDIRQRIITIFTMYFGNQYMQYTCNVEIPLFINAFNTIVKVANHTYLSFQQQAPTL